MATSTPKRAGSSSKVSAITGYNGPSMSRLVDSYQQLVGDEIASLGLEVEAAKFQLIESLNKHMIQFIHEMFVSMESCKDELKARDFAKYCKEEWEQIDHFVSEYLSMLISPDGAKAVYYAPTNAEHKPKIAFSLQENCPYYIHNKFMMCGIDCDMNCCDQTNITIRLRFYRNLWKAVFTLFNFLLNLEDFDLSELTLYSNLFMDLLGFGKVYEMMNPMGKAIREQEDATLELLTNDREPLSNEEYDEFYQLFDAVCADITEGRLKYVRRIKRAIDETSSSRFELWSPEDYYISTKASPMYSKYYRQLKKSILKSMYETDPIAEIEVVAAFDDRWNYHSAYNKVAPDDLNGVLIKCQLIQNNGKYKNRLIFVACNAIQDRCNIIQLRSSRILDALVNDCTTRQGTGIDFLLNVTRRWSLQDADNKASVLCFDFSNATDTLDQEFQCKVLEFFFDKATSDFWKFLSQMEKVLYRDDGTQVTFKQKCGQPQGLLGSFNSFALAHHFVMLMTMKASKMENFDARDFYRILGDDSAIWTIDQQFNHVVSRNYQQICRCANLIINLDKSTIIDENSSVAMADFAKVTVRNGEVFTPTPYRLCATYGQSITKKIATMVWRQNLNIRGSKEFCDYLISQMPEEQGYWYNKVLKGSILPIFKNLADESLSVDEAFKCKVRFTFTICALNTGIFSYLTPDRDKETTINRRFDGIKEIIKTKVDWSALDAVENDEHKIWYVLNRNCDIEDIFKHMIAYDAQDERYLSLVLNSLDHGIHISAREEQSLYKILQSQEYLEMASQAKPGAIEAFEDSLESFSDNSVVRDIDHVCNRLLMRSTSKRPSEETMILESAFQLFQSLEQRTEQFKAQSAS